MKGSGATLPLELLRKLVSYGSAITKMSETDCNAGHGCACQPSRRCRQGPDGRYEMPSGVRKAVIAHYAATGEWLDYCAKMFGDDPMKYPPSLRFGAEEARAEYLLSRQEKADERKDE